MIMNFRDDRSSLRKIVKETEECDGIDWDNSAAKAFLKDCFEDE